MNRNEKKEFSEDCECFYKGIIKSLMIKWGGKLPAPVIRQMFTNWVYRHNSEKIIDLLQHRVNRAKKIKKLKEELTTLKTKFALEDFLN